MAVDNEAIAWIAGLSSAVSVSSIMTAVGSYYVMKEKVHRLEMDVQELKDHEERFVTFTHFDAVILPLRQTLDSVQVDIKLLLKMVGDKKGDLR